MSSFGWRERVLAGAILAGLTLLAWLLRLVYRVDAKSGAETLVRGVEMVGTPLTTVSRIMATSDTEGVFNGFCGAESGFVPVSTVASRRACRARRGCGS